MSIDFFPKMMIFRVRSIIYIVANILRCDRATFRLELPAFGFISRVAGMVIPLLTMTTPNETSMVLFVVVLFASSVSFFGLLSASFRITMSVVARFSLFLFY